MKKVLIFGMTENPGGVETFLMNYYRRLNSQDLHFDFLGATSGKIAYEEEIKLNSIVYHIPKRREHPLKYYKAINTFFKIHAHEYDCIWVNLNTLINLDYLKLAKKYGIKRRIIHSHSSQNMDSNLKKLIHIYNKHRVEKFATDFWACSELASKWFYPENIQNKVEIIKNAINMSEFRFDKNKRDILRNKYDLNDNFVIGNVGRLHFEKNQLFAIQVLNKILPVLPNAKLVLVGQGPDKEKLIKKINELQLQDKVILTGVQNNMRDWYSSFDCFIFPSLFEGLGLAGVEAQANGLVTFSAQKNIPKELEINSNFNFLDLSYGPEVWAHKIENYNDFKRLSWSKVVKNFNKTGYNLATAVEALKNKLME